jgi:hypothetical protein
MRGWLNNWALDRSAATLGLSATNCHYTCTVLYTLYCISMDVMNSIKFIISNTNQSNTYYIITCIPRDFDSLKMNSFTFVHPPIASPQSKHCTSTPSKTPLMEFCWVKTGVKLVWITGVRFDTGV